MPWLGNPNIRPYSSIGCRAARRAVRLNWAPVPPATNIEATAVNTIGWLSASGLSIVVPVYQRQYRWDIGGCEQLLADIRAVADADDQHTHFIGSILSTASSTADSPELVLIDGQQRITTLMLLIAALHHTVLHQDGDPALAAELRTVLVSDTHTKLRPHRAWAETFENVILDRPRTDDTESLFDDNYSFFRSQVPSDEVPRIWRGLQRLEHVAITLGADAHAQQIFESLNSTGEPLRDHELIHNYVLMGLTHEEQTDIEREFWLPIEQNTGDAIAGFWRHYLVMKTGREIDIHAGRGVYDAFRQRFPRLDLETLQPLASEWREFSAVYRTLMSPADADDADVTRQLGWVNTFGRGMYPLVMREYRAFEVGTLSRDALIQTLEFVQSLLLRRTIVGLSNDRLVARLCRADDVARAISRITPSDERVRVALKYGQLPHAAYVLGRLANVPSSSELAVEYIVPLAPPGSWSGDGIREWQDYSDDEQNSHRALAPSLGNLTLLENSLFERGFGKSFPAKQSLYSASGIQSTSALAQVEAWGTATIADRTMRLTSEFLTIWTRPPTVDIDDDGLTPILDAKHRRGWPRGWEREFEYVEYCGEHWEVPDVKYFFDRVFKRLWADAREHVVAFTATRGGPIYDQMAWNGQWHTLDESHYLYLGWDSHYMLTAIQGVLEEAGLAADVSVKYSYVGAAM